MADDLSLDLETTVPTDLSASPESSEHFERSVPGLHFKRSDYELKKQQQEIQMLKIALSQKDLKLESLKAEYIQKTEELEEKLLDLSHQKQLLQARLESEIHIQREESKKRKEVIQRELESILKRQRLLEEANDRLQEKAVDVKRSVKDIEITDTQYHQIKGTPDENLSLKDFVAVKLYEAVLPWKKENMDLHTRCRHFVEELRKQTANFDNINEKLFDREKELQSLYDNNQKLVLKVAELQQSNKSGDYKIENFDRIMSEKEKFEAEVVDLRTKLAYLEALIGTTSRERDDLTAEVSANKQTIQLLRQDKDYFSKQVTDLHNRLLYAEERVSSLNEQLERTKQAREDLYDKYVASRDQYKSEYETKLREELEQIRVRTNLEMERLNSSGKDLYERENRNLREARDMAMLEKDRALDCEKDALAKHQQLLQEYRQLQATLDNHTIELRSEVKRKTFEVEQAHVLYEDTIRKLKESQLDCEKLEKKLQTTVKEYYSLQNSLERRIAEQEVQLQEKNLRLETYEKLEKELDEVVLQAAEVQDDDESEKVLFSYGYGANVPTQAKRRLKQSVHLARRILAIERENSGLKQEIERRAKQIDGLRLELKNANSLLDASQQPYQYLVESIRLRDQEISKLRGHIAQLTADIMKLKDDRVKLAKAKNQLSADLEKMLNQKEEMSIMKQVVLNLSQHRRQPPDHIPAPRGTKSAPEASPKRLPARALSPKARASEYQEPEENLHRPAPTHFVAVGNSDWQKQLRKYPVS